MTPTTIDVVSPVASLVPRPCRGCGAPVLWVTTAKNKRPMPIDTLPPYRVVRFGGETTTIEAVSHFATCQQAGSFRRSRAHE